MPHNNIKLADYANFTQEMGAKDRQVFSSLQRTKRMTNQNLDAEAGLPPLPCLRCVKLREQSGAL